MKWNTVSIGEDVLVCPWIYQVDGQMKIDKIQCVYAIFNWNKMWTHNEGVSIKYSYSSSHIESDAAKVF